MFHWKFLLIFRSLTLLVQLKLYICKPPENFSIDYWIKPGNLRISLYNFDISVVNTKSQRKKSRKSKLINTEKLEKVWFYDGIGLMYFKVEIMGHLYVVLFLLVLLKGMIFYCNVSTSVSNLVFKVWQTLQTGINKSHS